jgi:hypothetical protein
VHGVEPLDLVSSSRTLPRTRSRRAARSARRDRESAPTFRRLAMRPSTSAISGGMSSRRSRSGGISIRITSMRNSRSLRKLPERAAASRSTWVAATSRAFERRVAGVPSRRYSPDSRKR